MDLARKWNQRLRRKSRKTRLDISCPVCGHEITTPRNQNGSPEVILDIFEKHFAESHTQLLNEKANKEERVAWIRSQWEAAQSLDDRSVNPALFGILLPQLTRDSGIGMSPM
jgi:hypothetical protein